ncbi:uncharacterized protein METZ01_LOCUS177334 [marine metagenome]|uniref:Lipoprotein n=1 Tax=marine metagenome TaxID=408172 RepID=A0A382CEL6_9ZZZZ
MKGVFMMKKSLIIVYIFIIILIFSSCQSRAISRWTGGALQLQLPTDFDRPISFASGRKNEKDLCYWTKDGLMKVKTYTDWGLLESEIIFVQK